MFVLIVVLLLRAGVGIHKVSCAAVLAAVPCSPCVVALSFRFPGTSWSFYELARLPSATGRCCYCFLSLVLKCFSGLVSCRFPCCCWAARLVLQQQLFRRCSGSWNGLVVLLSLLCSWIPLVAYVLVIAYVLSQLPRLLGRRLLGCAGCLPAARTCCLLVCTRSDDLRVLVVCLKAHTVVTVCARWTLAVSPGAGETWAMVVHWTSGLIQHARGTRTSVLLVLLACVACACSLCCAREHACVHSMRVCVYAYVCMCACACAGVYTRVCVCVCKFGCVHECVCSCIYVYACVRRCGCVCMCVRLQGAALHRSPLKLPKLLCDPW